MTGEFIQKNREKNRIIEVLKLGIIESEGGASQARGRNPNPPSNREMGPEVDVVVVVVVCLVVVVVIAVVVIIAFVWKLM